MLLERGDKATCDDLLTRICAAVKPLDIIEEMLVGDLVFSQWDLLILRRFKNSLIKESAYEAPKRFLGPRLEYMCLNHFEESLAATLHKNLSEHEDHDQDFPQRLARGYARKEPNAVEKVHGILDAAGLKLEDIIEAASAKTAAEAIRKVNELPAKYGVTMHDIFANKLTNEELDQLDRIDRLIMIAETRRNASLREIERYRAVLGAPVRRHVQEIEDAEFELIETTPPERPRREH